MVNTSIQSGHSRKDAREVFNPQVYFYCRPGIVVIITNVVSMEAAVIVTHYKQLWKIEDAFGEIKGTLKARPMFHWNDKRIMGHLMLCFLAYLCEAHLTKSLRKNHEPLDKKSIEKKIIKSRELTVCLLYTSPSPRDRTRSR